MYKQKKRTANHSCSKWPPWSVVANCKASTNWPMITVLLCSSLEINQSECALEALRAREGTVTL